MDKDSSIADILSNSKLRFLFGCLKTSKWRSFSEKEKEKFYLKLNKIVCKTLKFDVVDLVIGDGEINEDNFLTNYDYKNLIIDFEQRPLINDVNYNQYLTLYEYFFRIRMQLLQLFYVGEYKTFFSEEKIEKINNNFINERLGGINLKIDKDDMEDYEDYQYINKEAREFAETILFKIVKDNYDFSDGYDEEMFMSNYNVLVGELVNEIGESYLNDHISSMSKAINKLRIIKNRLERLDEGNLSKVSDKDLFFIVYPSIIHNCDIVVVLNAFNEIIRRIYKENFKITWKKSSFIINDNSYPVDEIDNLFNIVLYECLNDMNKTLNNKFSNKELVEYKKKWLIRVVRMVDSNVCVEDFGIFKYQSIYRLLNKERINGIVNNLEFDYLPLKKGGSK